MKKIPETTNNWFALTDLINGGLRHRILVAALRLRVFDHLDWCTSEEIAACLEAHPRNTGLFLNALAGMGFIRKRDGRYGHTEESKEFLVTKSPTYLGDYLLHVSTFHEKFAMELEDLVHQGPPPAGLNLGNESIWAESARLSAAYQYSGEAQNVARMVSQLPEFEGMTRMLDMGGGSGFYTMAMVSTHPTMKGVVLEQPAVAEVTRDFVREYGMDDRVSVIAGDYMMDDLQGPYNLVFASATLNFFKHRLDELFARVYDALAPGGIFITHQDGIKEERTQPVDIITGFLIPEMMGADYAIAQGEIAEAMLRSGFRSVRSFTKRSSMGEMDVDLARKARDGC